MNTSILKRALISEKSFQAAGNGKFTFIVDPNARKDEIVSQIEELFDVHVLDTNIANYKGKVKQSRKGSGKRSDFKKVIVTLKKGEKIDLFEVEKPDDAKSKKEKVDGKKENAKVVDDKETTIKVREKK